MRYIQKIRISSPLLAITGPNVTVRRHSHIMLSISPAGMQPVQAAGRRAVSAPAPKVHAASLKPSVTARASSRSSDSSFVAGFVTGGVVFGVLGFLLAPQISKALLSDDARLRLPRFLEDETPKDPEATKQDLIDKIAQLNASIDEVAAQLKSKDGPGEVVEQTVSLS